MKVGGIVLCGGHSRRMGKSKAWLACGREHLLHRVVRIVADSVGPVVVAARPDQELPPLPDGASVAYDAVENGGPLGGIAAGLEKLAGKCQAAFVTSCDHPLLKRAFIIRLVELLDKNRAVVPMHDGRWYPLSAVYRLDTRSVLDDMLSGPDLRAREFARRCGPRLATEADLRPADPELDSLRNVNNPADYQRVIQVLEL